MNVKSDATDKVSSSTTSEILTTDWFTVRCSLNTASCVLFGASWDSRSTARDGARHGKLICQTGALVRLGFTVRWNHEYAELPITNHESRVMKLDWMRSMLGFRVFALLANKRRC